MAAMLLVLSALTMVSGVALYSPQLAVLVASVVLFLAGLTQLNVKDRR